MLQASDLASQPVQLHVMHNWGGGLERWVQDYCRADTVRKNMVLKPARPPARICKTLELYQHIDDDVPIRVWDLSVPIYGTCITNLDYCYILEEIIKDFDIKGIIISSFIGHSLDILNTGIKTLVICHDYYPFCPALNIYFDSVCKTCKFSELQRCFKENRYNSHFPEASASGWMPIRKIFFELILHHKITLVAPSSSVKRNLIQLEPALKDVDFVVIPHGVELPGNSTEIYRNSIDQEKIKVLILGRLASHKGLDLLKESYREILETANIYLLGCGERGHIFEGIDGIYIIAKDYGLSELREMLKEIAPDIALLLSTVPETFSYTLSELTILEIPTIATKIGSFEDRIEDGVNGFLVTPDKNSLIQKIREVSQERQLLSKVANNLKNTSCRTNQEMVEDYHKLVTLTAISQYKMSEESKLLKMTQAEVERSQAQLQQTQAEVERSQAQLQQTQAELAQLQAESQAQIQQSQAELARSQAQVYSTQAELTRSQAQLYSTQGQLEQSNTTIAAMETSKFWKLRTLWFKLKEPILKPLSFLRNKVGINSQTLSFHKSRSQQTTADSFIAEISPHQPLVKHSANVDIIVCVHNALNDVKGCLESVVRYSRMPYSLILVDDGSSEETCRYLKDFANSQGATRIRNKVAKGYTFAANQGLHLSQGEYAVLLNSDTVVTPNWLDRIVACGESDPQIGLIGPLSNTASWQSIPEIAHQGDWAENQLPEGMTIADWAKLVAQYSDCLYPRLPFLNGFCLTIKQRVIKELGYFDEATFGEGYGEENDYCLRAFKAGWQLAIADDAYVYHSQSRSYSHERRKLLCARSDKALVVKHGQQIISDNVNVCRFDRTIQGIRAHSQVVAMRQSLIEDGKSRWEGKRVLFILPIIEPGGGGNVVLQEAAAMQKMGVDVRIANFSSHRPTFERSYPQNNIPVIYVEKEHHIAGLLPQYDAVIATLYKSVDWLEPLTPDQSLPIRGYYIQDFEPYFFPNNSEAFRTACNSYTRYPDLVRITKTEWNRNVVKQQIGVECSIVGPSVNIDLYRPRRRRDPEWPNRPLRIAAMIRPSTPRRNPKLTLEVLRNISQAYRENIEIILFGCESDDPNFLALPHDFAWRNAGILTRPQLAFLLNEIDIFVDFSTFQAMGLTAMEAMACGVAAIVPENGGAQSFARHEENSLMVDTNSPEACVAALKRLIIEEPLRSRLQRQAIVDICQHFPEKAAYNTLKSIFPA